MSKKDFTLGSSKVEDFFAFITERHAIYRRRIEGQKKPWTDDPILQQYKFTNVFRQLDKGTGWLHRLLNSSAKHVPPDMVMWTVCWYRMFNWWEHAEYWANRKHLPTSKELEDYILDVKSKGRKVFTAAHMTTGTPFEAKHLTYIRACEALWKNRKIFTELCKNDSMEFVFYRLIKEYLIGRFVGYEIVCDLAFTRLLDDAKDRLTWANMGPGAQRGLQRLGFQSSSQDDGVRSMRQLHSLADSFLPEWILNSPCAPFELREIEHSLCEFDKYERVRTGAGRPRQKYPGV